MSVSSSKWLMPLFAAASLFIPAVGIRADISQAIPEFGDLRRWAVFSLGGGVTETDTIDQFTGTTDIYGDVGVAGDGNISLTGSATIHGDLYWHTPGTLKLSGNAQITGMRHHDLPSDAILDNGVSEANGSSTHAANFTLSSTAYASLTNITSSMTLYAQHDRPGNSTVLNLNSIVLGNQSTLTLSGTATDVFIFNVGNQFSLTSQSKIVLTGGLSWDDVLFNIKGNGSDITLDGQSTLNGILMANKRTVSLSGGSLVAGEVIANKIKLSGSSRVVNPSVTSP
jgi:Ice-binding-like